MNSFKCSPGFSPFRSGGIGEPRGGVRCARQPGDHLARYGTGDNVLYPVFRRMPMNGARASAKKLLAAYWLATFRLSKLPSPLSAAAFGSDASIKVTMPL